MNMDQMSERPVEFGDIKAIDRIPAVFKDEEVRARTKASIGEFKDAHNGKLPTKFQLSEFIFDRDEQICTADTRNKYLAWSANDLELAAHILFQINPEERSVVLRSNMMEVADDNPTLQITKRKDIDDFVAYVAAKKSNVETLPQSRIWDEYFAKVKKMNAEHTGRDTLDDTVAQLLTNITEQKGLFLIRPTFIYDEELRREMRGFEADDNRGAPQTDFTMEDVPEAFLGFRVLPIGEFSREKKKNLGYVFVYDSQTKKFEIRSGFPDVVSARLTDVQKNPFPGEPVGRTINFDNNNQTTFHYQSGEQVNAVPDTYGFDSLSLNKADLAYLQHVLQWQLPRIFTFEDEIRRQQWLEQGLSTTHQFVIFPPEIPGDQRINTQMFDFHTYDPKQLEIKAQSWFHRDFEDLTTLEKQVKFF